MKRKLYVLLLICLSPLAYGQNTLRPGIYFQDMNYYNPSAVAMDTSEKYSMSIYGKQKFVENDAEIWNKPASLFVQHIGKIKEGKSFYSLSYLNDNYSFYTRNTVYAGYTYRKKWTKAGTLSFGGRAVLNFDRISWTKLRTPHGETGKTLKFTPDIDLGIQYQLRGFTAGLSSKNVLGLSCRLSGEELLKNRREAYFNVSYLFRIGRNFKVAPYALWYWERKTVIDGGMHFSLFNRVSISYLLRLHELRSIYAVETRIYQGLHLGVSADRSRLLPDNNLDLVLRYLF
jgi:type IX secretion system PorP/SprF family membrane protein